MQECTVPTEKAAVLCLSFARFLFNGLNYQGLFTLPTRSFRFFRDPPFLSLSLSLIFWFALLSPFHFRLFIRFLLIEPVAVQSSDLDRRAIEFLHYPRPLRLDETFAGRSDDRRQAGRFPWKKQSTPGN